MLCHGGSHVIGETRTLKGPLRHVDQMRSALGIHRPSGRCRCQKARMSAHDNADINAGQRVKVEINTKESPCHKLRSRYEARRVVVLYKIIVDGLWRMNAGDATAGSFGEYRLRPGRVVAPDIDERVRANLLQAFQYGFAVSRIRLVPCAAERGARCRSDRTKLLLREFGQRDKVAVTHPSDAVQRPEDARIRVQFPRLQHSADDGLVDDGGWSAALRDNESLGHLSLFVHKRTISPMPTTLRRQKARSAIKSTLRFLRGGLTGLTLQRRARRRSRRDQRWSPREGQPSRPVPSRP